MSRELGELVLRLLRKFWDRLAGVAGGVGDGFVFAAALESLEEGGGLVVHLDVGVFLGGFDFSFDFGGFLDGGGGGGFGGLCFLGFEGVGFGVGGVLHLLQLLPVLGERLGVGLGFLAFLLLGGGGVGDDDGWCGGGSLGLLALLLFGGFGDDGCGGSSLGLLALLLLDGGLGDDGCGGGGLGLLGRRLLLYLGGLGDGWRGGGFGGLGLLDFGGAVLSSWEGSLVAVQRD